MNKRKNNVEYLKITEDNKRHLLRLVKKISQDELKKLFFIPIIVVIVALIGLMMIL